MFAQLGSIIFENLKGFSDFNKTGSAIYAEHALLDGKPRLQRAGTALDVIDLSIKFHVSFCNPAEQLSLLRNAKNNGEILPLVWGNGKVDGSFVITEMTETIEDADSQGNIFSYQVSLTLSEYVTGDKLKQEQEDNKKNAKAVGDKKPTAKKKKNTSTCPQTVSKIVTRMENYASQINAIFTEKGGPVTSESKNKIKTNLNSIEVLCNDLQKRAADANSCASEQPDLGNKNIIVKNQGLNFSGKVSGFSIGGLLYVDNDNFQLAVKNLKAAARPLVNQSITRK
jgi:phage protein U